jgi:hypothetical protein
LNAESRQQQTKEVTAIYKQDSGYQTLIEWAADIKGKENLQVLKSPENPGVTGTAIIEMSEEEARQTQKQLPEFFILKDQPIDLIKPDKVTTSFKEENDLQNDDLWHFYGDSNRVWSGCFIIREVS